MLKEIACEFGRRRHLKGILSVPVEPQADLPAVVLVSAGLTAKCGPYRLYVELARAFAARGFTTLRFDLGGIGISQVESPGRTLAERTQDDIDAALTFLATCHGVREFAIGGLCSGAEDAFRHAAKDERVCGVILIDPHSFATPYWRCRRYLTRYTVNRILYRLLRLFGAVRLDRDSRLGTIEGFEGKLIDYQYMTREEATQILEVLLARGTHVHYIYTGGSIDRFHHVRQFAGMFPGLDVRPVTVDFLPYIEHVQIFGEDRLLLVDTVVRRSVEAFGMKCAA
jgi:pimeloyl-ACP methyl ester carboxylesterase